MCLVAQSCPTLCNSTDYSPPGSSVYGDSPGKNTGVGCHALFQAIFWTQVSHIAGGLFTNWATREALLSLWFNKCWQFDLWFSAFSKPNLYIWKFSVHVLKPNLKNFEHNLPSMRNEHNCTTVWAFLGTALLWDWNENWPFPVLWPLLSFPNLLTYWVQDFNCIIF